MFVFIEDSEQLIPHQCSLISFGTLWLEEDELLELEAEVFKLRIKYDCWGEFKWTNLDKNHFDVYKEIIDIFCKIESIKFNSITRKLHSKAELDEFHNSSDYTAKMKLIYQVIAYNYWAYKNNICLGKKIRLIADEPFLEKGKYKDELLENFTKPRIIGRGVPIESARKAHSHIAGALQLVDFLTGMCLVYTSKVTYSKGYSINKESKDIINYSLSKGLPLKRIFTGRPSIEVKINNWFHLPRGTTL